MNVYKTTTLLVSCQMEFQAAGGKNYTINTQCRTAEMISKAWRSVAK